MRIRCRISPAFYFKASLGTLTSLTGQTTACITNTVNSCKQQANRNLRFHCCWSVWSPVCYLASSIKSSLEAIESQEELDVVFGAEKNLWEKSGVMILYMLFVDCLHFYSLCSQSVEMCSDLIDPDKSVWLQQKKQKSWHNNADCTQYLYINMCMIHASFENS